METIDLIINKLTHNYNCVFQKLDTTIRFFNRSDYYTVHGSDALFAAQEVFKTTSVCKMIGAGKYHLEVEQYFKTYTKGSYLKFLEKMYFSN